ncbi:hypothetical protein ZWY2020_029503 [Hordeum vulgare]|nr:hypothetical protein ZWY2020_029503 [Hordeum vulgare]
MVGNDWINSYLEAILDAGGAAGDFSSAAGGGDGQGAASSSAAEKKRDKASLMLRERGRFNPARYFVEEVISGFDETDLYKTWVRTSAMRSPQERNTRLENMSWRIWNSPGRRSRYAREEASCSSKKRLEREKARRDAAADLSEDLSDGEKGENINESSIHAESTRGRMPRIGSTDAIDVWANQHKDKKLYIVLISIHGLIRGENMELGRDSDTGGQVKYVVELARALGETPGVYRVDLLTRQISAPDVDWSYGEPTEISGAYIVRIPFGPREKYIPKEQLWPHIQEFVDGALVHIMQMSKVLGEQVGNGQPVWPVVIHGHYADAGDSAALLSGALNVPMVFTGHSLGRDKLEQLLKQGRQTRDEVNATYKIMRRIEAEELCLDASEIVITSTRQEIDKQWGLYNGFDVIMERKLRARIKRGVSCYGREMPRMIPIPPGMEFSHISSDSPDPPVWADPMILALARPDPKKNITTLVKAFGEHHELRNLANLTLIMGNRDVIDEMSSTNGAVLTSVLKLIDKYDLYGQVAYPKHHKQSEVPDIYRLAARTKGVFINCAYIEPFGLTLIEAAAYGLPMVATQNGGPVDIHRVLDNGILVDPHNQNDIAEALYRLVSDKQLWAQCRKNGLENIHPFSWPEHCKNYLSRVGTLKSRHPRWQRSDDATEVSETDSPGDSLRDIHDISLNLKISLDSEKSGNMSKYGRSSTNERRNIEDAVLKFSEAVSAGTKDESGENAEATTGSNKWPSLKEKAHRCYCCRFCARWTWFRLSKHFPGFKQRKIIWCSWFCIVNISSKDNANSSIACHVLYSHDGSKLNFIPVLASRSQALRYLYIRWGVELSKMTVVVGESGDTDYEGLLGGMQKTIILKGSFNSVPNQLHAARSYSLEDVVSFDKPGIASVEGYSSDNPKSALQQFAPWRARINHRLVTVGSGIK